MAGLKELIMTLYDYPPYLDSNTNNKGLVVIRDAALSILDAATPAELSMALSSADWFNGNLARFGLLTPEPDYKERSAPKDSQTPTDLADRLRRLHERLPEPPQPDALGEKKSSEAWSLSADIWSACHAYEQALRAMTAPSSSLDDRLRAVYGRLHVQAIKVATLLAAMDWADGDEASSRPKVTAAHWYDEEARAAHLFAAARKITEAVWDNLWAEWQDRRRSLRHTLEASDQHTEYHIAHLDDALNIISKIGVLFKRLDASSQKKLLREIVERVVLDPCGKVIRMELLPPFSYPHQLSDRIGGGQSSGSEPGKTKTSISAGSCSNILSLGGPEGLHAVN